MKIVVVQLLSHVQHWDPSDCSTPGITFLHHLPEFAQIHVHWVGDAIQPSYPVVLFFFCLQSFPASQSFPMSQLVTSGSQSIGALASVLDTGCLGLVHWVDPDGWNGEGGGRGVQDGEHMYTLADSCQCMTKPIQYCKVISLQKNKLIKKQKKQEVTKFSSRNSQTPKIALWGHHWTQRKKAN